MSKNNPGPVFAGDNNVAFAEAEGTAIAGKHSYAIVEEQGYSQAGEGGTALGGYGTNCKAGRHGVVLTGDSASGSVGEGGILMLKYFDTANDRWRVKVGYVGEDIKADTFYELSSANNFVECPA